MKEGAASESSFALLANFSHVIRPYSDIHDIATLLKDGRERKGIQDRQAWFKFSGGIQGREDFSHNLIQRPLFLSTSPTLVADLVFSARPVGTRGICYALPGS